MQENPKQMIRKATCYLDIKGNPFVKESDAIAANIKHIISTIDCCFKTWYDSDDQYPYMIVDNDELLLWMHSNRDKIEYILENTSYAELVRKQKTKEQQTVKS